MFTAIWGMFLISLFIVSVGEVFSLTRQEKKAMHHLMLTRKAAASITSAMRYFISKRKFHDRLAMRNSQNVASGFLEFSEGMMSNELVEESDLEQLKKQMQTRLGQFRDEWVGLKQLSLQNEAEQEQLLYLIKHEVIDIADRFDRMEGTLGRFATILDAIVTQQGIQVPVAE